MHVNTNTHTKKTIMGYMLDSSMYINKNECNNYTPPFLTYISMGIPEKNIEIENSLRNANVLNSRCPENKTSMLDKFNVEQKKECSSENSIVSKYIL